MKKFVLIFTVFSALASPAQAETLTSGGASGPALCQFLTDHEQVCNVSPDSTKLSDEALLREIRNLHISIGIVPAVLVTPDDKAEVILYTSPLRTRLLVANSTASKQTISTVMKLFYDSFAYKDNFPAVPPALLKNAERPRELKPEISFHSNLTLHPGVAMFYEAFLDKPKGIAYDGSHCNRKTGECVTVFDAPAITHGIADTLADVGLPMVPYLKQWLKLPSPTARSKAAYALGEIYPAAEDAVDDLLQALAHETDDDARESLVTALGNFQPAKPETIAALVAITQQEPIKRPDFSTGSRGMNGTVSAISRRPITTIAATALAKIDPDGTQHFAQLLQSPSTAIQLTGVRGLSGIVSLDNEQWRNIPAHRGEFPALTDFTPASQKAIALLQQTLHSTDAVVKKAAVFALTPYGDAAANADVVAALLVQLQGPEAPCTGADNGNCHQSARAQALYAVRAVAKYAANAATVAQIASIIESSKGYKRTTALETLAVLAKYTVIPPEVLYRINVESPTLAEANYIHAIGKLATGTGSKDLLAFLRKQLSDAKGAKTDRAEAAKALAQMVKEKPEIAADIVPVLIQSIKDEQDESIRQFKIEALATLGPAAADAVPMLLTYITYKPESDMEDVNWVRSRAAMALGQIGVSTPEVRDALEAALRSTFEHRDEKQLRYNAATSLLKLFPNDDSYLTVFLDMMKVDELWCKTDAMRYIEQMGPRAKDAVNALTFYVKYNTQGNVSNYRYCALKALHAIGTPEAMAVVTAQEEKEPHKIADWEAYLNALYAMKANTQNHP